MKVSRETLDERLRNIIATLQERKTLYLALEEQYNIPVSISADICSNRRDISEFNDFIAFAFFNYLRPKYVDDFFTEAEITAFSKEKYEARKPLDEVKFTNMIRVNDDQWIGSISIRQLMELKDAQLIKYNENTQRTLQRIVRGENRFYKIFLNKKSVAEIRAAFESGAYISDDITLNVPIEEDEYDPAAHTITFSPPKMMDILDGYHRYIAISQALRDNPGLDYEMEIRIVSFSEEKAQQFIYQKDQKTQMKRVDSATMNKYNPANVVVDTINSSPRSNLQGEISRNNGNIEYPFLSSLITYYYFRDKRKKYSRKQIIETANDLIAKFNNLTSEDTGWIGHRYINRELQVVMFCFSKGISDAATIRSIIDRTAGLDSNIFALTNDSLVKQKLINQLTALGEGT